jgi:DNA-binding CsgD family transcriptional regulator
MTANSEKGKNQDNSTDAKIALSKEIDATVIPLLQKLKEASTDDSMETTLLFNVLESNLQHVVNAYGYDNSLTATYRSLTPVEALVASMIRQGLSTLFTAKALHISPGTVSIHRKHIRKKLGLQRKGINLHSYLQSLA